MKSEVPETMIACLGLFALGMVSLRSADAGRTSLAYWCFVIAMAIAASITSLRK